MPPTVKTFYEQGKDELGLSIQSGEEFMENPIPEASMNRPGLALAGFFQYFAHRRLQVLGLAEYTYLKSLTKSERKKRLQTFFNKHVPCVILTRNRHAFDELAELAQKFQVPLLRSPLITGKFINTATLIMEKMISPQVRLQGTMVDIMGIGVLIEGAPGIGKSEAALALIEKGYSLVADDVTVMRRMSGGDVIGSAVEITRYHMEIRGLGIIHVPSLFGVASVRGGQRLDMIIRLHPPDPSIESDRTGLAPEYREVLGVDIPLVSLPVMPGRSSANVIEVAALNQKLKGLGHDAAKELDESVVRTLTGGNPTT